ncbi:MAG: hypothetical protein KBT48_09110 [Firmicutes bacterium]|nr:hypothetical protein [Bacillota bacterium]
MKLSPFRKIQIFAIAFCIAISSASGYYYMQSEEYRRTLEMKEDPTTVKRTTFDTGSLSEDELSHRLKLFPPVYKASLHFYAEKPNMGMYTVPGLDATRSLKDGKYDMCTRMTPQGLCVTDNYIIISAYCHSHLHNSMLFILDKESHKFVKEIILPGKPHAGGLAYDPKRKEIWIASKKGGIPELCILAAEQIEAYSRILDKPIKYKYRYALPSLKNASYLTYHDDRIYVGTFSFEPKDCKLQVFSLKRINNAKEKEDGRYFIFEKQMYTDDKVQGVALDSSFLYFSRSDGPYQNSKLDVYENWVTEIPETFALVSYSFPERMEQIYLDKDKMYILFESASNAYNQIGINFIDRVLVLNRNELLKTRPSG